MHYLTAAGRDVELPLAARDSRILLKADYSIVQEIAWPSIPDHELGARTVKIGLSWIVTLGLL